MDDLRTAISEYTNDHLLSEYHRHPDQYTAAALEIMREEIAKRHLDAEKPKDEAADEATVSTLRFTSADLIPFDHSFSRTDLALATAMLQENKIPFFINNPDSSGVLPIQGEAELRYTISIHKDFSDQSHALLDEHFIKADNKYILKYTAARDRLRAFNFHDIHLTELAAEEELEVTFTSNEKKTMIALAKKLLTEAESVEKAQDRVLFYFDSIEPLIEALTETEVTALSRNALLTMLEVLQVYIDDPLLPASMDDAIAQLLGAFLGA